MSRDRSAELYANLTTEQREHKREYLRNYNKTNAATINAGKRRSRNTEAGKDRRRSSALKCKYGITLDQRDALLASQGGRCALPHCKNEIVFGRGFAKSNAHLDHDHVSGKIRGVLCGRRNTALGGLGDSVDSIAAVLEYLKRGEAA